MSTRPELRAVFTNDAIRAIGALARQQEVCREQGGKVVFVSGMDAAREYILERVQDAADPRDAQIATLTRELEEARQRADSLKFDLNLFAAVLGVQGRDDVDAAVIRLNAAINAANDRATNAEAQRGALTAALIKVRAHTAYIVPSSEVREVELTRGLLQSIERIAEAALAGAGKD